jgi:hypothetical protein
VLQLLALAGVFGAATMAAQEYTMKGSREPVR